MEPVQYGKTSVGVDIAFVSMREGPPLVKTPPKAFSHAQRDWARFPWFQQPALIMFAPVHQRRAT